MSEGVVTIDTGRNCLTREFGFCCHKTKLIYSGDQWDDVGYMDRTTIEQLHKKYAITCPEHFKCTRGNSQT